MAITQTPLNQERAEALVKEVIDLHKRSGTKGAPPPSKEELKNFFTEDVEFVRNHQVLTGHLDHLTQFLSKVKEGLPHVHYYKLTEKPFVMGNRILIHIQGEAEDAEGEMIDFVIMSLLSVREGKVCKVQEVVSLKGDHCFDHTL